MIMTYKKPLLICIVGPTAIGKTTLAIEVAKAFSTEILSSDSRQFYKEMQIGTAVPKMDELSEVKHHFIQNRSIFEPYSVGDFEKEAIILLDELFKSNEVVVMVGGSGLYIDAVVNGLDEFPEVKINIREKLNKEITEKGIESLQNELKNTDPVYFSEVDIHNPHRVIRALEIIRSSGLPYSSFRNKNTNNLSDQRKFNTIFIGLSAKRDIIYERINERVDQMIECGLIDEAKMVHPHKDLNALQTVGYKELFKYFDDVFSLNEAIEEIKKNTRKFAKRQETWFKKNESINWFDYKSDPSEIIDFIKEINN